MLKAEVLFNEERRGAPRGRQRRLHLFGGVLVVSGAATRSRGWRWRWLAGAGAGAAARAARAAPPAGRRLAGRRHAAAAHGADARRTGVQERGRAAVPDLQPDDRRQAGVRGRRLRPRRAEVGGAAQDPQPAARTSSGWCGRCCDDGPQAAATGAPPVARTAAAAGAGRSRRLRPGAPPLRRPPPAPARPARPRLPGRQRHGQRRRRDRPGRRGALAEARWTGPTPPVRPLRQPKVVSQKDKAFIPRVVAVPVGSKVDFRNDDPYYHNVFSLSESEKFDTGLYAGGLLLQPDLQQARAGGAAVQHPRVDGRLRLGGRHALLHAAARQRRVRDPQRSARAATSCRPGTSRRPARSSSTVTVREARRPRRHGRRSRATGCRWSSFRTNTASPASRSSGTDRMPRGGSAGGRAVDAAVAFLRHRRIFLSSPSHAERETARGLDVWRAVLSPPPTWAGGHWTAAARSASARQPSGRRAARRPAGARRAGASSWRPSS